MPGDGGCGGRESDFTGETGRRNVASALSGTISSSLESVSGGVVFFIDWSGDQLAELKLVVGRCADMSGSVARWAAPRGLFGVDCGLGSVGGGARA
jgi:hypothetical protein